MAAETQKLKVFISWSGERANIIARGFHKHLPETVNGIAPFMSGRDIDKGTQWSTVLNGSLQESTCCIVCLTHESVQSPWVAFETGAISKAVGNVEGARSRIWTYLIGLENNDTHLLPFGQYQATGTTQEDTFRLVESVNMLSPDTVSAETLRKRFDALFWPDFSKVLERANEMANAAPSRPSPSQTDALLSEILSTVRSMQSEMRQSHNVEADSDRDIRGMVLVDRLAKLGMTGVRVGIYPNGDASVTVNGQRFAISAPMLTELALSNNDGFRVWARTLLPKDPNDSETSFKSALDFRTSD